MGCHFLLQGIFLTQGWILDLPHCRQDYLPSEPPGKPLSVNETESEVAQLCQTLQDPMDCNLPGSSVHEIFQARVLEWGAIALGTDIILASYIVVTVVGASK